MSDGWAYGWCPVCNEARRPVVVNRPDFKSVGVQCPNKDDDEHRAFFAWLWKQAAERRK